MQAKDPLEMQAKDPPDGNYPNTSWEEHLKMFC
jgi:hypothetical protein